MIQIILTINDHYFPVCHSPTALSNGSKMCARYVVFSEQINFGFEMSGTFFFVRFSIILFTWAAVPTRNGLNNAGKRNPVFHHRLCTGSEAQNASLSIDNG